MAKGVFQVYSDPAHGWVRVPVKLLEKMDIADKVSGYSYERGNFAYLEEDADGTLFAREYAKLFGKQPKFNFHISDRDSKIRSYPPYGSARRKLGEVL